MIVGLMLSSVANVAFVGGLSLPMESIAIKLTRTPLLFPHNESAELLNCSKETSKLG